MAEPLGASALLKTANTDAVPSSPKKIRRAFVEEGVAVMDNYLNMYIVEGPRE